MAAIVTPSSPSFQNVPGFKTQTLAVSVQNTGAGAISLAFSGDPDFTLPANQVVPGVTVGAPTPVAALTLSYRATKPSASAALTITDVASGAQLAVVPISGSAVSPLSIAGTTEFGSTVPGGSVLNMLSIVNQGDTSAALAGVASPFVLLPAYADIGASSAVSVPVTYAPSAAGDDSVTVTLSIGSVTAWSVTGTLHGICSVTPVTVQETVTVPPSSQEPTSVAAGTQAQAYYVGIPNPATSWNLGYRRSSTILVDGAGLDTVGNLYARVSQDIGILADGTISIQTTPANSSDINIVSSGNLYAAAAGGDDAWLVGSGGVFIATMTPQVTTDPTTNMPTSGNTQLGVERQVAEMSAGWALTDAFIGLAVLGVSTRMEVAQAAMMGESAYGDGLAVAAKVIGVMGALGAVGMDLTNVVDIMPSSQTTVDGNTSETSAPTQTIGPGNTGLAGVTIYGKEGVVVGTPAFASYYAAAGLCIGSAYPTMVGLYPTIIAMKDLSLTAWFTATLAGTTSVIHGTEAVNVESAGKVYNRAQLGPAKGAIEIKPDSVELATSADGATINSVKMTATGIEIDAGVTGKITLKAGGWQIEIGPSGVTISQPSMPTGPSLSVQTAQATLKGGPMSSVTAGASSTVVQYGASAQVITDAIGVATKGPLQQFG